MQPPRQCHRSRVDLVEFKAQMVKKLGAQESKQYFCYLNMFLSLKLSKVEFNKVCFRILGRENISLHNQLIRAILRNACTEKVVPPASRTESTESINGYRQNGSHPSVSQAYGLPGLSNGSDVLHLSPRKARTGVRVGRTVDHCSALDPNWKTCFATRCDVGVPLGNGGLHQHEMENGSKTMVRRSSDGSVTSDQTELAVRDDEQQASTRNPLRPPFGVQFHPTTIQSTTQRFTSILDNVLLDSLTLKERMEQISRTHGLEGVSMDSTNILNHALDSYIKGLIMSCIELSGTRSGHNLITNNTKDPSCTKLINGVKPGHQHQTQNNAKSSQVPEPNKPHCPISFQDLKAAVELNPQKLGIDWPLLLEKIGTHAADE